MSKAPQKNIPLKPFEYLHVLDGNTNVTRLVVGPRLFVPANNETVVQVGTGIVIPAGHFCKIANPVARDAKGDVVLGQYEMAKIQYGQVEYRFATGEPFPLYPGEQVIEQVQPLTVVERTTALRLVALGDFTDDEGKKHAAGDEWLFEGPATYRPHRMIEVLETVKSVLIRPGQALRLRARGGFVDRMGQKHLASDEWLVRTSGNYLPDVFEEIVGVVNSIVITQTSALMLSATRAFTDVYGHAHNTSEEWLVTSDVTDMHIPDVYEKVVKKVDIQTLSKMQYCVVVNPVGADGVRHMGKRELRKGPCSFFLQPQEELESGICDTIVLTEFEALLLQAREAFEDKKPGQKWMIKGPTDFIPSVEVCVLERRGLIALNANEGIYVRDLNSGAVRTVSGQAYMLQACEALWEKELPPVVESCLANEDDRRKGAGPRDKTRAVTFPVPHNCASQIYDYKTKVSRVVFGPALAMLEPDEVFTVLDLSGGKPKVEKQLQTFTIFLAHGHITDIIKVETSDHARLELRLSFDRHFEYDPKSAESAARLFAVNDYIGDVCKAVASRVRGAVASTSFDTFHKHSDEVIRKAVFGMTPDGLVKPNLKFPVNGFVITAVDIQSIDPVDEKTRKMLQKSVQLAIEITTQSQERAARHEAETEEQISKGKLKQQRISDEAEAEQLRAELLKLRAESNAVETTGRSIAEAKGQAEASRIEGETEVDLAKLRMEAEQTEADEELERITEIQRAEIEFTKMMNQLEMQRSLNLSEIEVSKFEESVTELGAETLMAIAEAGPEMQAKMLKGLGFTGLLGGVDSPLSLFSTPGGIITSTVNENSNM